MPTEEKGPVASVKEPATASTPTAPTIPSASPVRARPNREAMEKAREKAAERDDPDTVYEVDVSQWGHDDYRFVRGQLVAREDIPEHYDFVAARNNGTLKATGISVAELRKMEKEATATALAAEGLKA